MKILLLSFSLLSCFIMVGQNLVPNPSFEDTIACPRYCGDFSVADWISPSSGSPDLFHTCSDGSAGAPQNEFGWQFPRTGNAYAGGHTSDFSGNNGREYIQCQLNSSLILGEEYEASFFVSRTDSSTKACDNIGAFLSVNPISSLDNFNFDVTPQVISPPNEPIVNNTDWIQIIDTITADLNYNYLTLGVFTNDTNTNWVSVEGGWEDEAHYYYDDISISQINGNSILEGSNVSISLYPNPSHGGLNVISTSNLTELNLYSTSGEIIHSEGLKGNSSYHYKIDLPSLPSGVYFVELKSSTQVIRRRLIIHP